MMTKMFFLALLLPFFCNQQDYLVKKTWLFSKTEYSGNVPRLPGGQQAKGVRKKLLYYIEVGKDQTMPQWHDAYYNGGSYAINDLVQMNQDSIVVGVDNKTKTPIVIKPTGSDKIVQLMLTLRPTVTVAKANGFTLNGTFNYQPIYVRSAQTPVELVPDMMP